MKTFWVAMLHGAGCTCPDSQTGVIGPFTDPDPDSLLMWAKGRCEAAMIARLAPPKFLDSMAARRHWPAGKERNVAFF